MLICDEYIKLDQFNDDIFWYYIDIFIRITCIIMVVSFIWYNM